MGRGYLTLRRWGRRGSRGRERASTTREGRETRRRPRRGRIRRLGDDGGRAGGFASVKCRDATLLDLSAFQGVALTCEATGRRTSILYDTKDSFDVAFRRLRVRKNWVRHWRLICTGSTRTWRVAVRFTHARSGLYIVASVHVVQIRAMEENTYAPDL